MDDALTRFWGECGARLEPRPYTMLLPASLATACACALKADGAGLSAVEGDFRVPLGASDETAGHAERLQFTQGQGPCLEAALQGRTLIAGSDDIRQRWPQFADELFKATPYRAVLTLPLSIMSATKGAIDLYFVEESNLYRVLLADAAQVSGAVVDALHQADDTQPQAAGRFEDHDELAPSWLTGPAANHRRYVWLAVGMTMAHFDFDAEDALALLRAYAYGHNEVLDDVALALVDGQLLVTHLRE